MRVQSLLDESGMTHPRVLRHEIADAFRVWRERQTLGTTPSGPDEALDSAERLFPGYGDQPSGPSQNHDEILPLLHYLAAEEPKVVVEIGTERGGTHFVFGTALPTVEQTIAVDLLIRNRWRLRSFVRPGLSVNQIQGDSRARAVMDKAKRVLAGREIDVLFIDGDHSYMGATEDFRLYSPLVRQGGIIAFHDIVPDQRLRTGIASPMRVGEVPIVWRQIREQFESREFVSSWEQDGRGIGLIRWDRNTSWPFGDWPGAEDQAEGGPVSAP